MAALARLKLNCSGEVAVGFWRVGPGLCAALILGGRSGIYGPGNRKLSQMRCFSVIREDNGDRTTGGGLKLKEGRFRLDLRRKSFARWAVRPRHSCPQSCGAPLLEVLKDEHHLGWWGATNPWQGLGLDGL